MTKHIFVTGGVVSSLGKGITAASLAFLLKQRGYRVAMQKLDPYLNVDPGTMSPYQHGEVFVTDDGAETDLDLGHYERFAEIDCSRASNYTSGRIYGSVIARERSGGYLGATVQVIPHVTNEIKAAMRSLHAPDIDVAITEIGGTAGDIESLPFLEAARQFIFEAGRGNAIFIHLTLVPYIRAAKELKTKPSQHSVATLRSIGIAPDVLVCRTEVPLEPDHFEKLAMFCNVSADLVIEELDVRHSIYEVPPELAGQQLDVKVLELLRLPAGKLDLTRYNDWLNKVLHRRRHCTIAVVGKYIRHQDAYKSVYEALDHGGIAHDAEVEFRRIEAEELERGNPAELLGECDGILVPGGFGDRGVPGKIVAVEYARTHDIPFLGICLGMQCAVIEFARHVAGLSGANSTEFDPSTPYPVIELLDEQRQVTAKGGTMRLGQFPCQLKNGSRSAGLYRAEAVGERHRHRYEFNPAYRAELENAGLAVAGTSPDDKLVEIVELPALRYFIGCQFHPEFKSRPRQAHPLFAGLIAAAMQYQEEKETCRNGRI
ncbi:CTP synthase [Victivallis sp. Marseille-Q1083]|uniref:CTP synthase n=1 Tax=Victivallis sp. Marseille-Q1083 TaxID=2717288 RepID=UPI00158A8AE6|nr:CTP synthase [Victivallis sp. Marseille-Q1083]